MDRTEIFQYLRNWFVREKIISNFIITGGALARVDGEPLPLLDGQYFRIIGSALNNGVHKFGDEADTLRDELQFSGAVWTMAVPTDVLELEEDIKNWVIDNEKAINSPYQSENISGYYSYAMRGGDGSTGGSGVTWQGQFLSRLLPWRKI